MIDSFTMIVSQSEPKMRLDTWLHRQLPHLSRSMLSRLIREDQVHVDGKKTKAKHSPKLGERIVLRFPPAKPCALLPEAIPLNLLYEDECLIVLDKAPELCTHPSAAHPSGTLVNALLHHCRGRLSDIGGVLRPGIVHRLDKDTSGCIVVAKTNEAHGYLAKEFAERRIHKSYLAIACGNVRPLSGKIEAKIARHPSHRKQMASDTRGKIALTSYRVMDEEPFENAIASLIEANLYTGRTHQIRVHFCHIGFPLFGDIIYGKRQTQRLAECIGHMPTRQMLHAYQLAFTHPKTRKFITYESSPPADFQKTQHAIKTYCNTRATS